MLSRVVARARPLQASLRRLSTAVLPDEPPVRMYGIAGRYANALYVAAAKKKELLEVEADLKLIGDTVAASPVLKHFIMDPSISRSAKATGMMSLAADAGACTSTKNVLAALAEGGRTTELLKVVGMYSSLLSAAKGEVDAVITSAKELDANEMKEIQASIVGFLPAGSKVSTTIKVDSSLVAGITIMLGDKFIDLSVASQIKRLQSMLAQ